jgi:2-octaprenyl-6-methoxyphenol hydroxylase
MNTNEYDVLIVGGGMVGATLACALADFPLRIGIVERFPLLSDEQPSYDDRSIALAYGSSRIFSAMGLWGALRPVTEPIRRIHISDRGHFGATRLDSREQGTEALGYVVENREMGRVLHDALSNQENVSLICPAHVQSIHVHEHYAELEYTQAAETRRVRAALVVAADGTQSLVREQLHIPVKTWQYNQTAIITNVSPALDHHNIAYERFTETGPLALLPMRSIGSAGETSRRCSLVWTVRNEQVEETLAWPDDEFLARLQTRFGQRLGKFQRVGSRHAYPLNLVRATEHIQSRVALIGNAAHTLHPVAGQGYNLGIRDVAVLAELLASAARHGEDPGAMPLLQQYADWRRRDHRNVIAFTDGLVRIFTNPLRGVQMVRDAGLLTLDLLPPMKNWLARQTMGLGGKLPRLGRGLPL